jgi:hypothetical protein
MDGKILLRISMICMNSYSCCLVLLMVMRLMNHFLCAFIGKFIVIYFDDILVYNKSIDGNIEHLCYVLNASKNENYMLI